MKFKIIEHESEYESESEYDTAVDISHSHIYTKSWKLKSLSGLELDIYIKEIHSSMSYYNPGDDYECPPNLSVENYSTLTASIGEKIVVLTPDEFKEYFTHYIHISEKDVHKIDYTKEIYQKLEAFKQQQINPQYNTINLDDKELDNIVKQLKNKKEHTWFELEFSKDFNIVISELEEKKQEINQYNSANLIDNMTQRANAKLDALVEKLVQEAKSKIVEVFKPKIASHLSHLNKP